MNSSAVRDLMHSGGMVYRPADAYCPTLSPVDDRRNGGNSSSGGSGSSGSSKGRKKLSRLSSATSTATLTRSTAFDKEDATLDITPPRPHTAHSTTSSTSCRSSTSLYTLTHKPRPRPGKQRDIFFQFNGSKVRVEAVLESVVEPVLPAAGERERELLYC
jgi:hypothetical protein